MTLPCFPKPSLSVFLSICLSVSVSLGKSRPFADTSLLLTHTHIYFLSLSVYHSCSFQSSIHLPAFLLSVSGVFEARAAAVASGVIQCDRTTSITQAEACWTSLYTGSHNTHTHTPAHMHARAERRNKHVDYTVYSVPRPP